jgi:hypothetical protein
MQSSRPFRRFLLLALAVLLAGCGDPQYTDVSIYVDAPEALALVGGPGWEALGVPEEGAGLLADPGLGPLPVAPEDMAVTQVKWVRGQWGGRSHITWDEEVEYDVIGQGLTATTRLSRGPDRLREDITLFLGQATTLGGAEADAIAEQALGRQWATWPDEGNSPYSAYVVVDLPLDLEGLVVSHGLKVAPPPECCLFGGYIDAPDMASADGWSLSLKVRSWSYADPDPEGYGFDNDTSVTISVDGRLATGGQFYANLDRAAALAAVQPALQRAGLGNVSLAGANVQRHGWSSW